MGEWKRVDKLNSCPCFNCQHGWFSSRSMTIEDECWQKIDTCHDACLEFKKWMEQKYATVLSK